MKQTMFNWKWATDILKWEAEMVRLNLPLNTKHIEGHITLDSGERVSVLEFSPWITGPRFFAEENYLVVPNPGN